MLNALIINTDGTFSVQEIDGKLATLQGLVGGWIEAVHPNRDTTLFVNEEGKLSGQPLNELATLLWWALDNDAVDQDFLVGPVVVLGPVDANGDETSVHTDTLNKFALAVMASAAVDQFLARS